MDIIKLLEYLEEVLNTSSKIPLTGKVMIDKDEFIKIIEEVIDNLPNEFKKAKWICDEKEKILNEATKRADEIKEQKINAIKKEIENHDISKEAKLRSEQVIITAQKEARAIRCGAKEYAEAVLKGLQEEVDSKGKAMVNNIKTDVEGFMNSLEHNVSTVSLEIKENIKELKNMK